jgi:hypothetical protein
MGFYVRPEYLEAIHYYYFSIGIFSLTAAISFGFSAVYSAIFVLLYIGQSSFGWYLSWIMQKKMKEVVVITSWKYAGQHVFLTFFVGAITLFLWFVNAFNEQRLVEFVLYINYFIFFIAVLWLLILRFGLVKTLLDIYDSRIIESAKNLVVKTKEMRSDIFKRSIISNNSIMNYEVGTNTDIDELLMNAWREKGTDMLFKRISQIEIAFCTMTVDRLRRWITQTTSKGTVTPRERTIITSYEQAIEQYEKASVEYEKEVISKIPE